MRSADWFGGNTKDSYLHRAWMRRGNPDSTLTGKRPQIAILNTASDLAPCNMHLNEVAQSVKNGIWEAGGVPYNLPMVSLGESNVRPTAMLWRNMVAMAAEEMIRANPVDGVVLLGGCDKTIPALLMAAASVDLPALVVPGGPMLTGTFEGNQELRSRSELTAKEVLREVGAVLRMSEADAALLAEVEADPGEDQTMIINMGPQHPSTHGVLRLMLELKGETVLRCKPVIGYLHTGMEKTGESLTFMQGGTNVTRMDYASPLNNELVFAMTTEKLLGIDQDIPERAVWIRMLLSELNRISSHLLFMATNGMDLGAVSMMLYGFREREEVLRFFQKVTGLRMNHNFIRPGGVAADLPAGWRDDVLEILEMLPGRLAEYDILMTDQPIWRERLQGVGVITADDRTTLGDPFPDFTYGMTNTFAYKGFDLSLFMNFSYGNKVYNANKLEFTTQYLYRDNNMLDLMNERWKWWQQQARCRPRSWRGRWTSTA